MTTKRLPRAIWALGLVSLFMDVSSEMIHALLPAFLVGTLGASVMMVGLIEGLGEAMAQITKVFSGYISDRFGARKPLAVIGYGLGTLSKPLFALAPTVGWVLTARLSDRLGKGIRGAPRDALVADLAPEDMRGAAYGLRQSLDNVGAFVGPLTALALMVVFAGNIRAVFWVAAVPGVLAVLILIFGLREPVRDAKPARMPIDRALIARLGAGFWAVVALAAIVTLARFTEAFVILRAQNIGLTLALLPLVLVCVNVAAALSAYPAGVLSDRWGKRGLLIAGLVLLVGADAILATAAGVWAVLVGSVVWGLHLGMTSGLLSAQVAETAPPELRGTAFGVFNLASGVSMLLSGLGAGLIWDTYGPAATFATGGALACVALVGFALRGSRV